MDKTECSCFDACALCVAFEGALFEGQRRKGFMLVGLHQFTKTVYRGPWGSK